MTTTNSHRKRLFLIDGYSVVYRAHFALIRNPLITRAGLHTSALFGFVNHVFHILRSEQPEYLAAVFDSEEKTFRHARYPDYKATREKMPQELRDQLPYLWDLVDAMQLPRLAKPGYEADDIIGTLAQQAAARDLDVYIVSADKDFMQLVNDHIYLYAQTGRSGEPQVYDRQGVLEKWGVPPEQIIDLLGLMGDSSDNIPGVAGVGVKSAVKLLQEYGSLEAALDHAEMVGNKRVRQGLQENREQALLSKELVTIHTAVDLEMDVSHLEHRDFDYQALERLFRQLEFASLIPRLHEFEGAGKTAVQRERKQYRTITSRDELERFAAALRPGVLLSVDLETTSTDPNQAEIVGFSFSDQADTGTYIPILYQEKTAANFNGDDLRIVLEHLKPILENPHISKTGQNIKYDALVLKHHGVDLNGIVFDTMIAAHLIRPEARSYKLDALSQEFLQYTMVPITDLIGTGKNQISMSAVPLDEAAFYAAEDADVALQLTPLFRRALREADLQQFFEEIELPLIPVLTRMEYNGMYVDSRMLEVMSADFGKRLRTLVTRIHATAGMEFNVNSPQQLAEILFDILHLRQVTRRSTAEHVLEILKQDHPLPGLILEYRQMAKLKSTYLDALVGLVNPRTGRIHSTFHQTVAATGRLSSSNPNFQNIPIRREEGREIRKAFLPQQAGWQILSADYSQIELRIMAHLSGDPGLVAAFHNGEDVHARTASLVYNVPLADVLPEMRRTAKVVNFGIMYGAGPFRMSQELGIIREEAQALIDTYFRLYAGIKQFIDATLEEARQTQRVRTLLGRQRPVPEINSDNRQRREAAERMAINMPIQGTAAEMIKLAMIHIQAALEQENLRTMMILQVHDELVFEVPGEELEHVQTLIIREMEQALPLKVPVMVDCGHGTSWFAAH